MGETFGRRHCPAGAPFTRFPGRPRPRDPSVHLAVIATVFGLTFLAELPDKSLFAALLLGTRYRPAHVWVGVAAAFLLQMAGAVTIGQVDFDIQESPEFNASPLAIVFREIKEVRCRVDDPKNQKFPFIDDMRASGFLADAIKRSGIFGLDAAPAGYDKR